MGRLYKKIEKLLRKELEEENKRFKKKYGSLEVMETESKDIWSGVDKFVQMNAKGKLLRGMLVLLGFWSNKEESEIGTVNREVLEMALPLAVGFEFCQTAMLIQDDVLDGDTERRDMDTVHFSFYNNPESPFYDERWDAEEAAMLIGDIGLTYGAELIKAAYNEEWIETEFYDMLYITLIGEALDFSLPLEDVIKKYEEMDEQRENIALSIAEKKTALYSFSQPLSMGFLLAGITDDVTINEIKEIGKQLGIAYQLKNDLIGIQKMQYKDQTSQDILKYRITYANALAIKSNSDIRDLIWHSSKNNESKEKVVEYFKSQNFAKAVSDKYNDIYEQAKRRLLAIECMSNLGKENLMEYLDRIF